ncbi:MAG: hypothetical protein U5K30_03465 [Acidimicrobiales bacterium]|nr:hypothetical protein [Acidimicrobiales bacterium]
MGVLRASYQSLICSSARLATAVSMRAPSRRVSSPAAARIGVPKVTTVGEGRSRFAPLRMIRLVPARWIGTTGAPVRRAR